MNDTHGITQNTNWLITDTHITVNLDGKTHIVSRTDEQADKLIAALKAKRYDEVPELVSIATLIERYTEGSFKVQDGEVLVDGEAVNGLLATKIKEFHAKDLPYEPLVKFARNVRKNPSDRAQTDLFAFLDANKHPITDDGCFISYKKVSSDFKDLHTGTMDNSVGQRVEVPRSEVDDDPERTCSRGLHCCAWGYLSHFGGSNDTILEVKVDPKDVVAIPKDYNQMKMRTTGYWVLSVISAPLDCSLREVE